MTAICNIETCKSYSSVERLEKSLKKWGLDQFRYVIVCNSLGRFTAIFPASEAIRHGYLGVFSQFGFLTIG